MNTVFMTENRIFNKNEPLTFAIGSIAMNQDMRVDSGINLPIKVWRKALGAISKTGFRFLLLKWVNKLSSQELAELKTEIELCDRVPFSLHNSAYLFLDNPVFYDVSLSRTKAEMLRAKELGVKDFTTHPPMLLDPELPHSSRIRLFCDFLIELNDFIHEQKMELTISLENTYDDESAFRKPDELIDIIRKTNRKNIGLCLDTGHLNVLGISPANVVNTISRGMVQATHLHDNYGLKDEHNIPGAGNIDWEGVLQGFANIGYEGPLVLEVLSENPKSVEDDIMKAWDVFVDIKNIRPSQKKNTVPRNTTRSQDVLWRTYNEAESLFSQGRYDEAIAVYKTVIEDALSTPSTPKRHWATSKIAYIYQKTGRLDAARNVWKSYEKTNQLAIFDGMAQELLRRL